MGLINALVSAAVTEALETASKVAFTKTQLQQIEMIVRDAVVAEVDATVTKILSR